jgi:hypothetical protein
MAVIAAALTAIRDRSFLRVCENGDVTKVSRGSFKQRARFEE